jgi:hypothetical protein
MAATTAGEIIFAVMRADLKAARRPAEPARRRARTSAAESADASAPPARIVPVHSTGQGTIDWMWARNARLPEAAAGAPTIAVLPLPPLGAGFDIVGTADAHAVESAANSVVDVAAPQRTTTSENAWISDRWTIDASVCPFANAVLRTAARAVESGTALDHSYRVGATSLISAVDARDIQVATVAPKKTAAAAAAVAAAPAMDSGVKTGGAATTRGLVEQTMVTVVTRHAGTASHLQSVSLLSDVVLRTVALHFAA